MRARERAAGGRGTPSSRQCSAHSAQCSTIRAWSAGSAQRRPRAIGVGDRASQSLRVTARAGSRAARHPGRGDAEERHLVVADQRAHVLARGERPPAATARPARGARRAPSGRARSSLSPSSRVVDGLPMSWSSTPAATIARAADRAPRSTAGRPGPRRHLGVRPDVALGVKRRGPAASPPGRARARSRRASFHGGPVDVVRGSVISATGRRPRRAGSGRSAASASGSPSRPPRSETTRGSTCSVFEIGERHVRVQEMTSRCHRHPGE